MLALKLAPQVYSCFNNWSRQSSRKAFSARDLNCFEPDKRRYKKNQSTSMSRNWWIRWFDIKRFPRISNPSCNSLKIYIATLSWGPPQLFSARICFWGPPPPPWRRDRHGVAACRVPCRSCSSSGGWEPLLGGSQAAGEPSPGLGGTIYCKLHIKKKGKHNVLFPCSSGRNLWIHGSSF